MSNRLSDRQRTILEHLTDAPAPSKMELVRRHYQGFGHAASYATIARLERRGLVRTEPGEGIAQRVLITDAGAALVRS